MIRLGAITAGVALAVSTALPAAELAFQQHAIQEPWGTSVMRASDLDGDRDIDFIAATETALIWIENLDRGRKFAVHNVETTSTPADVAQSGDIDRDGDEDLVTHAKSWGGEIAWLENAGKAQSWRKHAILASDRGRDVSAFAMVDADGDGDLDLIYAGSGAQWVENLERGTQWKSPVTGGGLEADTRALVSGDFDGDQDADLVVSDVSNRQLLYAAREGNTWETPRALEKFEHDIYLPREIYAIDIDANGSLDIVAVSQANEVILYDNRDGKGGFQRKVLAKVQNVVTARPVDLDGDADIDLLAAGRNAADGIVWVENEGGRLDRRHQISTDWERPTFLEAIDLDLDGDLDIVSVSSSIDGTRTSWWENLRK